MFTKITPQSAQNSAGYTVFVADRELAGYEDDSIRANIAADFLCGIVPLYRLTIQITTKAGQAASYSQPFEEKIIERIKEGLLFLGTHTETVDE